MTGDRRTVLARGLRVLFAAAIMSAAVLVAAPVADVAAAQAHVVVGYFASWDIYARPYLPKDIPAGDLTHIDYAFATVTSTGRCGLLDPWADYERPFSAPESVNGTADSSGQA